MSKQTDIERLARFLGWTSDDFVGGRLVGTVTKFDPFTRLDDAMMVAEKIGGCSMCQMKRGGPWSASFDEDFAADSMGESLILAEAITLAALAYLDATEKK